MELQNRGGIHRGFLSRRPPAPNDVLWRPLVHGNVFEQFSPPQNRPLIWLVVAKADPHLRIAATGKPLLNFNPLLRPPKMHAKNTNCFLAMNAISCRKT